MMKIIIKKKVMETIEFVKIIKKKKRDKINFKLLI